MAFPNITPTGDQFQQRNISPRVSQLGAVFRSHPKKRENFKVGGVFALEIARPNREGLPWRGHCSGCFPKWGPAEHATRSALRRTLRHFPAVCYGATGGGLVALLLTGLGAVTHRLVPQTTAQRCRGWFTCWGVRPTTRFEQKLHV